MTENELYSKYVFGLCEAGNMTKAAKSLGISQPALSSGISALEKKLGVVLFNRKNTPITLTEEGRAYIEYLKRERILWKDLLKEFSDIEDAGAGAIVVGGPITYIEYLLLPACERLRKEFPECKISIKEGTVAELSDRVENGDVDCFISTTDNLLDSITAECIKEEIIYLCVPKASEFAKEFEKRGQDFSMLDGMDFVFLEEHQPIQLELNRLLSAYNIRVNKNFEVSQTTIALTLCSQGAGLCISSDSALEASGLRDRFNIYRLPLETSGRNIFVAYGRDKYMSTICKRLIEIIKEDN